MKPYPAISSSWTINEVISMYRETITVFNAFGMDTCCGADETIEVAGRGIGTNPEVIVSALLDVAAKVEAVT
jgi:iron-sulfur cluster repair protein YtfE (RIC family)